MIIWPTSRGWLLILNAIIWLTVAHFNRSFIAFCLAWSTLALLFTSTVMALFSLNGVTVKRGSSTQGYVGQFMTLPLLCSNHSRWRCLPFVVLEKMPFSQDPLTVAVIPSIKGHGEQTIVRKLLPMRRGCFRLEHLIIRSSDPAGLFRHDRKLSLIAPVIIYPQLSKLPEIALKDKESFATAQSCSPSQSAGFSQEFFGIRDYHPADGMRFIHWKSTAKFRKLIVKEYEQNSHTTIVILVDGCPKMPSKQQGPILHLEAIVSLAASICDAVKEKDLDEMLLLGGKSLEYLPVRSASEQFDNAMTALAALTPGETSLADILQQNFQLIPPQSTVFCLSLSESPLLRSILAGLIDNGSDVHWFNASAEAYYVSQKHQPLPIAQRTPSDNGLAPFQLSPSQTPEQFFS